MGLSSLGRVGYGPVVFNGPSLQTKSIQQVVRLDAANRGRTWTEYTLALRLLIGGQAGKTDQTVAFIRNALQTPGQAFTYQDMGYGPLTLNIGLGEPIWGPLTKTLDWEPLGNGKAGWLTWQVRVAIACDQGAPTGSAAPFIELLYGYDTQLDAAGYTTRRISVMGRIPSVRLGLGINNKELGATADDFREKLSPPLLPGFRRTYPSWGIDEGKTVIRGEIVDEELGLNFLPPGVAVGDASHEVSSSSQGLAMWQATISADFELAKASPIDQFDLCSYFIGTLCQDRIKATAAKIGRNSNAIVPLSLKMREDEIFGRLRASFAFSYSFTQPLKEIFDATGLWRPVPGSNWTTWAASMTGGPANPRGYAQMRLLPIDDSIVEGCGGRMPGIFTSSAANLRTNPPPNGPIIPGIPQNHDRELRATLTPFPEPLPENSYLSYESWIWLEVDSAVVPVRPLPTAVPQRINAELTGTPFGVATSNQGANNFMDAIYAGLATALPSKVPDSFLSRAVAAVPGAVDVLRAFAPQQRAAPLTYVFLRGHAVRYGFPVPIPGLTDYCGQQPVLACRLDMGEGYGHGIMRAANEKPIYMAKWNLRYLLPGGGKAFFFPPAIPNPMLDKSR